MDLKRMTFFMLQNTLGCPDLACCQYVGAVGHRLPGLLLAWVQYSPHFLFQRLGEMHTLFSGSSPFVFPHKGHSGAESRRVDQSKADS